MTDFWHASKDPTRTMRAVVYERHSPDPSDLKLTVVPRPVIRPHQILIEVKAASLNPADFKFRRGAAPSFMIPKPKIPGVDVSGIIAEVGDQANAAKEGSAEWKVGDRVAAMVPALMSPWGTLAEFVAVDAALVGRIPDTFPNGSNGNDAFASAASLPLVALTAIRAFDTPGYEDWTDKKVLIQAGAGGVGSFAIQYVKHVMKASMVATTASAAKAPLLEQLGADLVIDYHTTQFEDVVQDYDVVLDPMSWTYEKRTLDSKVLKPTGWYLNIPSSDWSLRDGAEAANGFSSVWNALNSTVRNAIKPGSCPNIAMVNVFSNGPQLQSALNWVSEKKIRPVVDRVFPVEDVVAAFQHLESGRATGKVVIDMTSLPKESTS